ncbi:hypothetical protein ACHAWF_005697 [Thalassiosira exigua]
MPRSLKRLYRRLRSERSSQGNERKEDVIQKPLAAAAVPAQRLPTPTQGLFIHTVDAALEVKRSFHESLPSFINEDANTQQDIIVPFLQDEIMLGPKVGHMVKRQNSPKARMKQFEKYHNTSNARYALKHIKGSYLGGNGPDAFVYAAGDLALEAECLANLNHPNITKLRGITHSGVNGFANGPCGYFLIIDRLFETLDQRITSWYGPANKEGMEREHVLIDECLIVAIQIAAAIKYMHEHSIIFRDLKPANIGFDVQGDMKIFDFGLLRI